MLIYKSQYIIAFCLLLLACTSGGEGTETDPIQPSQPEETRPKMPINISTTITRATDTAFENGDQIGLYVVNRKADGSSQPLLSSGNHVDNMLFTYSNGWAPATPIYWKDENTHSDFYLYYPYQKSLSSVNAMVFELNANQSNAQDYKSGDLLIGSSLNVTPTKEAVNIEANHAMSLVEIMLKPGNGFTESSLSTSKVSLRLNGLKTLATVDLASSNVTAIGPATTVIPYKDGDKYRAIVVPQQVAQSDLITVDVDGSEYKLSKSLTFVSGKRYTFTVTIAKSSSGINVSIGSWSDDGIDYGGTAN
ncbi:MAG: fimbrillin family protein [Prevotella sp.]|nr:fimbrillin family protein [Prevotella sp.]MDY5289713.1 fimbrillin family protein [Prevotella sp.]